MRLELREDAYGLSVRGRVLPEVERGREVLALMRAGALDGLSIGFRAVEGRTDPKSGVRRLHRVDLWEVSIVTFPMLPDAARGARQRGEEFRRAAGGGDQAGGGGDACSVASISPMLCCVIWELTKGWYVLQIVGLNEGVDLQ